VCIYIYIYIFFLKKKKKLFEDMLSHHQDQMQP
jgi:hypothetical protein